MRTKTVSLHLILASVINLTVLAAAGGTAIAPAQQPEAAPDFSGEWVNVNPRPHSVTSMVVDAHNIHPYGVCKPTVCDWGTLPAKIIKLWVNAQLKQAFYAMRSASDEENEITITLESDGKLRAEITTHYIGGRKRADKDEIEYFEHGPVSGTP
jgi:hypothetical protein